LLTGILGATNVSLLVQAQTNYSQFAAITLPL
jgi:hypothetical protein